MESTVWDKIYKEYKNGGKAWYTLSRGLDKDFMDFVEPTKFPVDKAFDVGFGTGHYLVWLKAKGWEVSGIDSSQTAHKIASEAVDQNNLILGSAYDYSIPKNTYGLIFSIHAIHHGFKSQIEKALDSVYKGLVEGGWIYLTLPKDMQILDWETHKGSRLLAPGTHAPTEGPEKGLPHSFYNESEIKETFSQYSKLRYRIGERGGWVITARK